MSKCQISSPLHGLSRMQLQDLGTGYHIDILRTQNDDPLSTVVVVYDNTRENYYTFISCDLTTKIKNNLN